MVGDLRERSCFVSGACLRKVFAVLCHRDARARRARRALPFLLLRGGGEVRDQPGDFPALSDQPVRELGVRPERRDQPCGLPARLRRRDARRRRARRRGKTPTLLFSFVAFPPPAPPSAERRGGSAGAAARARARVQPRARAASSTIAATRSACAALRLARHSQALGENSDFAARAKTRLGGESALARVASSSATVAAAFLFFSKAGSSSKAGSFGDGPGQRRCLGELSAVVTVGYSRFLFRAVRRAAGRTTRRRQRAAGRHGRRRKKMPSCHRTSETRLVMMRRVERRGSSLRVRAPRLVSGGDFVSSLRPPRDDIAGLVIRRAAFQRGRGEGADEGRRPRRCHRAARFLSARAGEERTEPTATSTGAESAATRLKRAWRSSRCEMSAPSASLIAGSRNLAARAERSGSKQQQRSSRRLMVPYLSWADTRKLDSARQSTSRVRVGAMRVLALPFGAAAAASRPPRGPASSAASRRGRSARAASEHDSRRDIRDARRRVFGGRARIRRSRPPRRGRLHARVVSGRSRVHLQWLELHRGARAELGVRRCASRG